MLVYTLIVAALVIAVLVMVIAKRPSEFRISRSARMAAPAAEVFSQVNDLHNWENWSPWAKLDPEMKQVYSGPGSGTGASYTWAGNNKIGEGSNTITESEPYQHVRMNLVFLKPFKASNTVDFNLNSDGEATLVTWSMSGSNNFIGKAIGLVMNCEKMVGSQFELGLQTMKSVVEAKRKTSISQL
jgi:hypothetical protein